jgi:hypothetical protein
MALSVGLHFSESYNPASSISLIFPNKFFGRIEWSDDKSGTVRVGEKVCLAIAFEAHKPMASQYIPIDF